MGSTTPEGSPPADLRRILGLEQSNPPTSSMPDASAVLAALAGMARQNTSAAHSNSNGGNGQSQDRSYQVANGPSNPSQQASTLNLPFPLPVNVQAPAAPFAPQAQAPNHTAQMFTSNPNPFAVPPPVMPPTALDPAIQRQLMVIKTLKDQGIPDDKIPAFLAAMQTQGFANPGVGGFPPLPVPQFPVQNQSAQNGQNGWAGYQDESRDRDHKGQEDARSPDRYRRRSRSRSPPRGWNARDSSPSRRRDGPNHDYERDSPARNRGADDRNRIGRANEYRQRSPLRRGRSPSPPGAHGGSEKWVGHDNSIGKNNIKGRTPSTYYLLCPTNKLQFSAVLYLLVASSEFEFPHFFRALLIP